MPTVAAAAANVLRRQLLRAIGALYAGPTLFQRRLYN